MTKEEESEAQPSRKTKINQEIRQPMYRFRVFVSYAGQDRQLAVILVDALKTLGLEPFWDKDIRPGTPFTDAIKGMISHAHLFMPIISQKSQERPWVHQETGYAMALNIPVLPIAVNTLPTEMISQLQAISINEDGSDIAERLNDANFEQIVFPPPQKPQSSIEIADWPETRAELLARKLQKPDSQRLWSSLIPCQMRKSGL